MSCCGRYQATSDEDTADVREVGPHYSNNFHVQWNHRYILTGRLLEFASMPSQKFQLEYSVFTQRGYQPRRPGKENQDSFCIKTRVQGDPNLHFFGVFDGHGKFGARCSTFVRNRLIEILSADPSLAEDPVEAYNSAFGATNSQLKESEIDDSSSGTTAITALVSGDKLFVANVGDSRAIIAVKSGSRVVAEDLSHDHKPFRRDEYDRLKDCGATVLNWSQLNGFEDPNIQSWGEEMIPQGCGCMRMGCVRVGLHLQGAWVIV